MLRKFFMTATAAAIAVTAMAPVAAEAHYYDGRDGYYQQVDHYRGDRGYYRGGNRGYYAQDRGYYAQDRGYYGGRGYRGESRCRGNGTTGTILGAIAGGLLGHEIGNGRYDNRDGTAGTVIGAGVGALAGRSIDRNC